MSSNSEYAIEVSNLGKCYKIYDKPSDRLKQMLFRGGRKYYNEFWALKDVAFKINKGETVGIVGSNGSGKSTILQMICGTVNPTSGEIKVNGKVAALLELGAGFNPEFTGVENVYMAASLYGLTKDQVDRRFDAIAAFADIGDHINKPVKTYSSGMYVRLAFAVIANVDAEILVIDEALAVGDAIFMQKCIRFIKRFKETGTLLFVSHDIKSVLSLCDKALWIDLGHLIGFGNTKEIVEKYIEHCSRLTNEEVLVQNSQLISNRVKSTKSVNKPTQNLKSLTPVKSNLSFYSNIESSESWKTGGAEIIDVRIEGLPESGFGLKRDEEVCLKITACLEKSLDSIIIGFTLKDELGQAIFGANTYDINKIFAAKKGELVEAIFSFGMPPLTDGKYFITAAIADGDLQNHVQQHWIHDALVISLASSEKCYGLIKPDFMEIKLLRK